MKRRGDADWYKFAIVFGVALTVAVPEQSRARPEPVPGRVEAIPSARVLDIELNRLTKGNQYSQIFPPVPIRWLDTELESKSLFDLSRWCKFNAKFIDHASGEPLALCVRCPTISKGARVWLESTNRGDGRLTLTLGHSGERVLKKRKGDVVPFVTLDIGTFDPGKIEFEVLFKPYRVDETAPLDELQRPIGRELLPDGNFPITATEPREITVVGPPELYELATITQAELRERTAEASRIYVCERAIKDGETEIHFPNILKGSGWLRGDEDLSGIGEALLSRTESERERCWIVFLPWDPLVRPPLPARADLIERVRNSMATPEEWSNVSEEWKIGLRAKRGTFKAGDPIDIEFVTGNRSKAPQSRRRLSYGTYEHFPMVKMELTTPDGKTYEIESSMDKFPGAGRVSQSSVGPGRTLVENIALDRWEPASGSQDFSLFTKPGEYKLRCFLPSKRDEILQTAGSDFIRH